ncbi:hypothetical protein ABL840_26800 [Variovorax sp. NFACC27]|uniref:hypothetical protein n=1 Tax=unclassified Variovorax TaxID=663243 RepID=UPI0008957F7B|nr:hypothetical protein SAMN03159371_03690 [Variovorax sp. NFACC28]SEG78069.1 hypothetical protein SAMN03159365_03769 [Variovorax sp. NFACC29]SFC96040.1 hypothetical protein SAMN03159379_03654 [Variovorax sp. NFACC26]SFG09134.1 hypothetical protein SAMN03159447_01762 [Variovorax sp. NFACC27]
MDDDDKIRRNLIVTSAVIIGVAWFNVSLPDVLERLFSIKSAAGAQAVQVSDWKVWVAALAMLTYMAWRYRWSEEVEKARALFQGTVIARYGVLFQRVYLREVAKWFRDGAYPKSAHPQMAVLYNQVVPQILFEQLGRRPDAVSIKVRGTANPSNGNENVEASADWNDKGSGSHGNTIQGSVYIDVPRQRALIWRARAHTMINSKESMSLMWPALFAVAAATIAVYKLVLSLI